MKGKLITAQGFGRAVPRWVRNDGFCSFRFVDQLFLRRESPLGLGGRYGKKVEKSECLLEVS
jgi:hypothetical protein